MTPKALRNQAIISYEEPEDYAEGKSGITLPSQVMLRRFLRGRSQKVLDNPPDIVRLGTVVSSEAIPTGTRIYFNKHDGREFKHEDKIYYAIPEKWILGYELST